MLRPAGRPRLSGGWLKRAVEQPIAMDKIAPWKAQDIG